MKQTTGNMVLYKASDGSISLDVKLRDETVWLNLNQLAQLFDRDKSVISRHLRNVFLEKELEKKSVVAFFATTAADEKTYKVERCNLDAILSVDYRGNSKRGTQFRIWATRILRKQQKRIISEIDTCQKEVGKPKDIQLGIDSHLDALLLPFSTKPLRESCDMAKRKPYD